MTAIKQRIAQQWPRFTVGVFALWGLIPGFIILWQGLQLDSFMNMKSLQPFRDLELNPEEEERVLKGMFIFMGSFMVLINGIALFASIRKSLWATKISLVIWIALMSWVVLGGALALIGFWVLPDSDRRNLPRPSAWDYIQLVKSLGLTLLNGWALLVFLRDLRFQKRNIWGRLVNTGGVFDYEPVGAGPVHL